MSREKLDGTSQLGFEWTEAISQNHAVRVLRFFSALAKLPAYTVHAKLGEEDLKLGTSYDLNLRRVRELGGTDSLDFVVATDLKKATLFADFDRGTMEIRAKSQPVLDQLAKQWKESA